MSKPSRCMGTTHWIYNILDVEVYSHCLKNEWDTHNQNTVYKQMFNNSTKMYK